MAQWISVDVDLPEHRKTRRLMAALGLTSFEAVAALVRFWLTVRIQAADGSLEDFAPDDYPAATGLDRPGQSIVDGLLRSGFVERVPEGHLVCHDWLDHSGKQCRDAIRKAQKREERRRLSADSLGQSGNGADSPSMSTLAQARAPNAGSGSGSGSEKSTPLPADAGVSGNAARQVNGKANGHVHVNGKASPEWIEAFHEHFWPSYPKKVDKGLALAAWTRVKPQTEQNFNAIMDGLTPWLRHWVGVEPSKILYPERWIKRRRWEAVP